MLSDAIELTPDSGECPADTAYLKYLLEPKKKIKIYMIIFLPNLRIALSF